MMGSAMDSTLVQVAVHDAVQAIDRRFEPYHVEIKGAKGSRSAAAEAAAHAVLVGMYPAQVAALTPPWRCTGCPLSMRSR